MSETCGDCERDFNLDTDYTLYCEGCEMYICLTCQCVRTQADRIDVLEAKIDRLESGVYANRVQSDRLCKEIYGIGPDRTKQDD